MHLRAMHTTVVLFHYDERKVSQENNTPCKSYSWKYVVGFSLCILLIYLRQKQTDSLCFLLLQSFWNLQCNFSNKNFPLKPKQKSVGGQGVVKRKIQTTSKIKKREEEKKTKKNKRETGKHQTMVEQEKALRSSVFNLQHR